MLSKKNQIQKNKYCIILPTRGTNSRKNGGCQGLKRQKNEELFNRQRVSVSEIKKKFGRWMVMILNATELFTQK
jgi:hypothetical protein